MTIPSAILKELIIAGYEGASLLAAFDRLWLAVSGGTMQKLHNAPANLNKAASVGLNEVATPTLRPVAPAVVTTPPPKNAKAIATKAIAQSMLSPSTIALAARLIEHFNLETGRCDPGSGSLANALGISVRQVRRSVASLVASGLFGKVRHGGRALANAYQPNWPLMVERAAEGDIEAKRPMLSAPAANVVTQNHLIKPDSDSMVVRAQRRRAAPKPDMRQRYLPLTFAGGRDQAEEAVRTKLNRQLNEHLQSIGKDEFVEGLTRSMSVDWSASIAAEMRKAGSGLPVLLEIILAAGSHRRVTA